MCKQLTWSSSSYLQSLLSFSVTSSLKQEGSDPDPDQEHDQEVELSLPEELQLPEEQQQQWRQQQLREQLQLSGIFAWF